MLQVWQRQDTTGPLSRLLWDWTWVANATFVRVGAGAQISELAMRTTTWEAVQATRYPRTAEMIPELPQLQEALRPLPVPRLA